MARKNSTRRSFVRSVGAGGALLAATGATGVASARGRSRKSRQFKTHLSGENIVPDPVKTNGQGQAHFILDNAGDVLSYKLNVANLDSPIIGAHIHHAPAGQNGGIVVFLYGDTFPAPPISVDGTLAQGTIKSKNVVGDFSDGGLGRLIDAIRNGEAYVLVHTENHVTGAIRGQIR